MLEPEAGGVGALAAGEGGGAARGEPKTVCRLVALDLRPRSSASLNRTR